MFIIKQTEYTKNRLSTKVGNAAKWSTITEVSIKLITPINNMILARLLAPDAFGVVATVTMIISFVDMITDAGLQKYLIQYEFRNEKEKNNKTNVAFWTNISFSLILWLVIIIFRHSIAEAIGNPGLGNVIAIAGMQILFTSFSCIQIALYRRSFDFKTLFIVRIIAAFLPLFITVPLAFLGFSYWAIIIGSICGAISNAIILTAKSKWRPALFYSFKLLKEMLAFSIWSLFEAISIWLTAWIDVFIIGNALNVYYLGLYKSSLNMVNSLMAVVTASIMPILFSALSRLQNDKTAFTHLFLSIQKIVAFFVFPIGFGLFIFRNLATKIMFGSMWMESSNIIGVWALTSAIRIVLTSIYGEAYRAKGKPKWSLFLQSFDLLILIPTCLISIKYGFWFLVYSRALIRLDLIIPGLIVMRFIIHISAKDILLNIIKPLLCTIIMAIVAIVLQLLIRSSKDSVISIIFCAIVYFISFIIFAKKDLLNFINLVKSQKNKISDIEIT